MQSGFVSEHRATIDMVLGTSLNLFHTQTGQYNYFREPARKVLSVNAGMPEGCTVQQLNEVVQQMENYISRYEEVDVFRTNIYSYDNAQIEITFKPEYENTAFPLQLKQEIASDSVGGGGCADIHLSADGRFLYASNRLKEDGVSVFSIDSEGLLQKVGYTLTGIHPRNFTLTPDGEYMLVAARDSNSVEVYRRDAKTGLLTATGEALEISMPVCLVWM